MTYWPKTQIYAGDSPSIDGFGRWRVSSPYTVFDSKQIFDSRPLIWDDSGSASTSTTHSINEAASRLRVTDTTQGTRVRQTFRRFPYQPGKSQEVLCTFSELDTGVGLRKRVGYFDNDNGIYLESISGSINMCVRSSVSGTPVNTVVSQSVWNLDKMDGSGPSEITVDWTQSQILFIDFEWLGVGRVRTGLVIDGIIYYVHQFLNANNNPSVYMSTPVLPLRYEITNFGTGVADDFVHICSSVISEGGQEKTGIVRHRHHLNGGTYNAGTFGHSALIGIRLKPGKKGASEIISVSLASTTNDEAHWMIVRNPTVAGSFTWNDVSNSIVQIATGSVANTITGGTHLDGGFFSQATPKTEVLKTDMSLGVGIDGTPEEYVITLIQLTANLDPYASLEWREER